MTTAKQTLSYNSSNSASGLTQLVTWAGGKKNELKHILPNVPAYNRYFEPFVGGGSVFMGINATEYYVNDFCPDLISLYTDISTSNTKFFMYLKSIDKAMKNAGDFFIMNKEELSELYSQYYCRMLDENNYDWSFAKLLSNIVGKVSSKGAKRNSDLRNHFFNILKEQGLDEEIIRMDMTLDLWGWMRTIDLLLAMANESSKEETSEAPKEEKSPLSKAMEAKMKKTRKRHHYIEIKQYSTDKKYIRSWKSISEAAKELNLNHSSISKCLNGTYKTAEGYIWEGIEADTLETAA